ncbi:MAG TPA: PIG-L family deacetylase [Candidatus Binatia bacterium]|nr:PIG-L family deacetylase [Candidatus Binatia bacterium]
MRADAGEAAPILAVSPHLDDVVFACGDLLGAHPGAVVVTVLAGRPAPGTPLAPWDADAGFRPGDDVIGARRREDAAALRHLGARPVWLDFRDAQYEPPPARAAVARALAASIAAAHPTIVLVPLGLFHSDHALVHDAALDVRRGDGGRAWLAYEEPTYRRVPGALAARLAALAARGVRAGRVPAPAPSASAAKRAAVACYASQLRALATPGRPGAAALLEPEGYWRLG